SVRAQDWLIRTPTKEMVFFAGLGSLKVGVDGIALSPNRSWLYYAAMNHDSLFRMPTAAIAKLPSSASPAPERVGPKPLSDGIACDAQGRVLITDVDHGAVLRSGAGGELETLIRSPRIRWADNLAIGQDGWVYLADSAIPDHLLRTRGHIRSRAPYFVFRFPQPGGNAPASPEMLTLAPSRPFPTESP
nr:hypothetical protein [Thermoanaerobaculia bacterium]